MPSPRTSILLLTGLVAGSAPGAQAQASAAASTTVQAAVVEGLTVVRVQDLDFGTVIAGSGLNPALGLASAGIGRLNIVGRQNRWVNVTLAPPDSLRNGAAAIRYLCQAAYNEAADQPAGVGTVAFACTNTAHFRLMDVTLWKNYGRGYLYVHGAVNVGPVVPGLYTATFTVTAAY